MNENPYETPHAEGRPSDPTTYSLNVRWWEWLTIGCILMALASLFLPAVTSEPRITSRSLECCNNLRQIGISLQMYHDHYRSLPPAYTVDSEGKPLHSWRTLILPFLEQQELYNQIDLSKPWNDPANLPIFQSARIETYACPSVGPASNTTTYLAVSTPESAFPGSQLRSLTDLKDGLSKVLLVIDVPREHSVLWYEPIDAEETILLSLNQSGKVLPHVRGVTALLADGSVRFLEIRRMTDELWKRLIDIDDGEPVELP